MCFDEITQEMLAEYHTLAEHERQIKDKRTMLRDSLLELLSDDAPVQPGRFTPQVSKYQARALTKKSVVDALGEEHYEWLCDQVAPVDRITVRVLDSETNSASTGQQKKSHKTAS